MKLRRDMLLALVKKDMYPGDPEKRELIYNKYKEFIIPVRSLHVHLVLLLISTNGNEIE
jgi:hypothetical protein